MKKLSFYKTVHQPYYIYAPNYTQKSAGIRVLHYLCHALNELGAETYLIGCSKYSDVLRTPALSESDVFRHYRLNLPPIVVYPEVVLGNPLNMAYVVRWLLNKPGYVGGDMTFDENEVIFSYVADYAPEAVFSTVLNIPTVNDSIFNNAENPEDKNRQGSCYYAHKYLAKGYKLTEHVKDATSLCHDVNISPQELAAILRRSEVLYCYEPSAIITEARLCGCPVVMVQSQFMDENLNAPISGAGIAYSSERNAILQAKNTVSKFIEEHQTHIDASWAHIQFFSERSQTAFEYRDLKGADNPSEWIQPVLDLISQTKASNEKKGVKPRIVEEKRWLIKKTLTEGRAAIMAERMANWQYQPTFHLVMLINSHEMSLLSDTLNSLQQQLYSSWGLTILSSESQPDFFKDIPENIEWLHVTSDINEEIEKTVNEAGLDWVMQLLPGDKLAAHALLTFAQTSNFNLNSQLIYSDEQADDKTKTLLFKPDFNLELLRSYSYLGRAVAIRREALAAIGGFSSFSYVYVTDMALKIYEGYGEAAIAHIDDVLYTAADIEVDETLLRSNEFTVRNDHFLRIGMNALPTPSKHINAFQNRYHHDNSPKASIVIANRNNATILARCVEELLANTQYLNYELIIVDQMSDVEDLDDIYQEIKEEMGERFKFVTYPQPNYAAMINLGVSHAEGEYVVVLSNTVMPMNGNWLTEMLAQAQRADVGVVGVRTVDADDRLIHGGGVLGITDDVTGMFSGEAIVEPGYMNRAHVAQEYASVSAACFMTSVDNFKQVKGLDEGVLANSRYCVVDYCLKVKATGLKNIWTPYATVFQDRVLAEKMNGVCAYSDNNDAEIEVISRWPNEYRRDSSYNRNLTLKHPDFSVETDSLIGWDEHYHDRLRVMAFPLNNAGNGEYRVRAPLRALSHEALIEETLLANHEFRTDNYTPNRFEIHRANPEVILFQNALSDYDFEFLKMIKAETNIFTVFGLDDLVDQVPKKNSRKNLVYRDMRHRMRRTLALSDRVIVSTQPIADAYADLHDDIVVVPNYIERLRWHNPSLTTPDSAGKPRVGWAGAQQHYGDLEILFEVVKETADEIDWVFFGMCPDELLPYAKEVHDFVVFDKYPEKLAELNLDLAVAPLEQNKFNEAKSNLRLLEYGVMGWPVICTDIYPYRLNNPPVKTVNNDKGEWLEAIQSMLASPEQAKANGKALKNWVLKNYILEDKLAQWKTALTPIK